GPVNIGRHSQVSIIAYANRCGLGLAEAHAPPGGSPPGLSEVCPMSASSTPHSSPLPLDAQRRIAEVCTRLDQAWQAGSKPLIEDFLCSDQDGDEQREL